MSGIVRLSPRAFVVRWRDALRWDVAYFQQLKWQWPDEIIRSVGEAIIRKRVEVDGEADATLLPIIEKISFGGKISITEPDARKGYKGRLFWASTGNLIYSKIRAKQGSLAIVPSGIGKLAVSTEYPVYDINPSKADAAFLAIVFRSTPFLGVLQGLSHGDRRRREFRQKNSSVNESPFPPCTFSERS